MVNIWAIVFRSMKWLAIQSFVLLLMPYLGIGNLGSAASWMIVAYTVLYAIYWELSPKKQRFRYILVPFLVYCLLAFVLRKLLPFSFWTAALLPLFGAACVTILRIIRLLYRHIKSRVRLGRAITIAISFVLLVLLKTFSTIWGCAGHGSWEKEKTEILQRRDYLAAKLMASPEKVIDAMPSAVGPQFQGEWALYSCSMFSAALANISRLYPETREENLPMMDSLISIVKSPELREYDRVRWGEDPIESLDGDESHVSYLSHLAWMIGNYKSAGGDGRYDRLYDSLCETMNRRILQSPAMNLPTYPGEPIYMPDMLVAIVALNQYSQQHNGKYSNTVREWISRARTEWCNEGTGLLVSYLYEDGQQMTWLPVKGSYSALNCSYLSLIDEDFAAEQYEKFKTAFWKESWPHGFKEYYDRKCFIGLDIDAGPILFGLSPSGTAFATGAATYFDDKDVRCGILNTAELAGHSVLRNGRRHYLLADIALVGESIMLAMRTQINDMELRKLKLQK